MAAAKAAQRREAQRRWTIAIGIGAVVVVAGVILVTVMSSSEDSTEVESDSTTTSAPAESAAGKPCVAMSSPVPPGAPEVPVKEGPPPTELVTEDLRAGDGAEVAKGANVTVNYIGVSCSTGAIFDTSYGREPATFPLDQVIPGWTNGIPGMKVGGQRLLGIPSAQAYGPEGRPPQIPPDESLWFVVEVLDAQPPGAQPPGAQPPG
jgi:peptidylprolyl isomerase